MNILKLLFFAGIVIKDCLGTLVDYPFDLSYVPKDTCLEKHCSKCTLGWVEYKKKIWENVVKYFGIGECDGDWWTENGYGKCIYANNYYESLFHYEECLCTKSMFETLPFKCEICDKNYLLVNSKCYPKNFCQVGDHNCANNTVCVYKGPGEYECNCPSGFAKDEEGLECKFVDPCSIITCKEHSTCVIVDKIATCKCRENYHSWNTKISACQPIDKCAASTNPCDSDYTKCIFTGPGTFECRCIHGYAIDPTNPSECIPIDNCFDSYTHDCVENSTCISTGPGTNDCLCKNGFTGEGKVECVEKSPCQDSSHCNSNSSCHIMRDNSKKCVCNAGYISIPSVNASICMELNNCEYNNICSEHEYCVSTGPGKHICICNEEEGYEWVYSNISRVCKPINNCEKVINGTLGGCHDTAVCMYLGPKSHSCLCKENYQGNPYGPDGCTAVDNCALGPTVNICAKIGSRCIPTGPTTNNCTCLPGYTGDGYECHEVNPCMHHNGNCSLNSHCTSIGPGERTCTCHKGYKGDGVKCVALDSCNHEPNGGCNINATCMVSSASKPICRCNFPLIGDGLVCQEHHVAEKKLEGQLLHENNDKEDKEQSFPLVIFVGSIGGTLVLISILTFLILRRKKEAKDDLGASEPDIYIGMHSVHMNFEQSSNNSFTTEHTKECSHMEQDDTEVESNYSFLQTDDYDRLYYNDSVEYADIYTRNLKKPKEIKSTICSIEELEESGHSTVMETGPSDGEHNYSSVNSNVPVVMEHNNSSVQLDEHTYSTVKSNVSDNRHNYAEICKKAQSEDGDNNEPTAASVKLRENSTSIYTIVMNTQLTEEINCSSVKIQKNNNYSTVTQSALSNTADPVEQNYSSVKPNAQLHTEESIYSRVK